MISRIVYKIVKIIQYIPVLWKDEDFDYGYVFVLLKYKLSRLRKCIENGYTSDDHIARISRDIKICEHILTRLSQDNYCSQEEAEIIKKFPIYRDTEDSMIQILMAYERQQFSKNMASLYTRQQYLRSCDYDLLFKILKRKISNWWD